MVEIWNKKLCILVKMVSLKMEEKNLINIHQVDIKRIVLSNKKSYGNKDSLKYFTGYT